MTFLNRLKKGFCRYQNGLSLYSFEFVNVRASNELLGSSFF
jgi:hypothetical protein